MITAPKGVHYLQLEEERDYYVALIRSSDEDANYHADNPEVCGALQMSHITLRQAKRDAKVIFKHLHSYKETPKNYEGDDFDHLVIWEKDGWTPYPTIQELIEQDCQIKYETFTTEHDDTVTSKWNEINGQRLSFYELQY